MPSISLNIRRISIRSDPCYSVQVVLTFYSVKVILWWEALLLLLIYVSYVLFMKINASAERTITKFLYKNKVTRVRSTDHLVPGVSPLTPGPFGHPPPP